MKKRNMVGLRDIKRDEEEEWSLARRETNFYSTIIGDFKIPENYLKPPVIVYKYWRFFKPSVLALFSGSFFKTVRK